MVRRQHIAIQVHARAKANAVYALLRDGASWSTWTPIDSFELERVGEREPEGVGPIRIFGKGKVAGRDQVAELILDRRFSYLHLSGLPVRDYRADVDLEPKAAGTRIRWRVSFTPKVPGSGWLWRWVIERFITQCACGLAAYAQTTSVHER
ncbi:MAG: SRPBCC family protein [Pseudonocardiales bacterium]|nr:MAG: SRPBCC family protein [Pseudonocardiales bacterium]